MAFMLYTAFGVLMSYLAVEPYIRRFWPEVLVSWNRLVSGKIGDAMVGRDILIGVVAGVVNEVSLRSPAVMASWFDWPGEPLAITQLLALKGPRVTVGMIADVLQSSITFGLYLLTFMLVLRLCTKRTWITVSIYAILWAPVLFYIFGKVPHSWPVAVMITLLHIWIMTRYGLLAFVAFLFTAIVQQLPIAVDASMGYGWIRVLSYGSILGLAAYGFWTSTRLFDALQNNRMASV
jgi:hypothetical protein